MGTATTVRRPHADFPELSSAYSAALLAECKQRMPAYMVPAVIEARDGPLPRNPNGKIDRKTLSTEFENQHKVQQ